MSEQPAPPPPNPPTVPETVPPIIEDTQAKPPKVHDPFRDFPIDRRRIGGPW